MITQSSRNRKIAIADGLYYSANCALSVYVPTPPESTLQFDLVFDGVQLPSKRALKNTDGNISVLISDILEQIKTNGYEQRPFSIYTGLDLYKTLVVSYTSNAVLHTITCYIANSAATPDSFNNSPEFLTHQDTINVDRRFEQGLNFMGEITLEITTLEGDVVTTDVGQAGDMNYMSFRGLERLVSQVPTIVNGQGISVDGTTTISGFLNNSLSGAMVLGTITATPNAQGNILTADGIGVIAGIELADGTLISFASGETEQGYRFGLDDNGNQYPIFNATGAGYSDNSVYLEHFNGCVKLGSENYIANMSNKNKIVEVF